MICPVCSADVPTLKAGIVAGKLVSERCDACYALGLHKKKPAEFAGKFDRDFDRSNHRREITQPWEADFVNAYPESARKYYSEEEMRRLGH